MSLPNEGFEVDRTLTAGRWISTYESLVANCCTSYVTPDAQTIRLAHRWPDTGTTLPPWQVIRVPQYLPAGQGNIITVRPLYPHLLLARHKTIELTNMLDNLELLQDRGLSASGMDRLELARFCCRLPFKIQPHFAKRSYTKASYAEWTGFLEDGQPYDGGFVDAGFDPVTKPLFQVLLDAHKRRVRELGGIF